MQASPTFIVQRAESVLRFVLKGQTTGMLLVHVFQQTMKSDEASSFVARYNDKELNSEALAELFNTTMSAARAIVNHDPMSEEAIRKRCELVYSIYLGNIIDRDELEGLYLSELKRILAEAKPPEVMVREFANRIHLYGLYDAVQDANERFARADEMSIAFHNVLSRDAIRLLARQILFA